MKNFKWFAVFVVVALAGFGISKMVGHGRDTGAVTVGSESESPGRDLASANVETLNAMIMGTTSANQFDPMIDQITNASKSAAANDPAHVYFAVLKPLKLFKGLIWRMRHIVEPVDAAYILSISGLRTAKRTAFRRGTHLDALFDYVTTPNPGENIAGQTGLFESIGQFQNYMVSNIGSALASAANEIKAAIRGRKSTDVIFTYDAGLVLGKGEADEMPAKARYRKVTAAHLLAFAADLEAAVGTINYFAAYRLDELPQILNVLAKNTLIAKTRATSDSKLVKMAASAFDVHLQSPKEVHDLLKSSNYAKFLTLRPSRPGQSPLPVAYTWLKQASKDRRDALAGFAELAKLPNQDTYIFQASDFAARMNQDVPTMNRRIALEQGGKQPYSDRFTGKTFSLNIGALFDPNNPGIQDLKKLFADRFDTGAERNGKDPNTFAWNYRYGEATHFPDPTMGGLLPDRTPYYDALRYLSRDRATVQVAIWLKFFSGNSAFYQSM